MALRSFLSTRALALVADNVLCVGKLGRLALVQFLECDLVLLLHTATLLWHVSPRATRHATEASHTGHSAEHLCENVVHVWLLAAATGRIKGGHAVCVVEVALVIVGKNLVGLFGRFEANLGFLALFNCDLVGVVCESRLELVISMYGGAWIGMYVLGGPCGMPS